MQRKLLPIAALSLLSLFSYSQQRQNWAFAITGEMPGSFNWTEVRLVDLSTGKVIQPIFTSVDEATVKNARTGKDIPLKNEQGMVVDYFKQPMATMVAAAAYDKQNKRLYYTPMGINQLRYIDLNGKKPVINYLEGESFGASKGLQDEPNHITRMVIDAGGIGYAISNDGNHFIQFTTGRKMTVKDLGGLIDDPKNGDVSVHTKCTSWGGDIVADAKGNLYLFTAFNYVFKVDVASRVATNLGRIKNLPAAFTVNGAVVDADGQLMVSSATSTAGYYFVDMNTLEATKLKSDESMFNASDLANGNLLFQQNTVKNDPPPVDTRTVRNEVVMNSAVGLYPNPVTDGYFKMTFTNLEKGNYEVQVVDIVGRVVSKKNIAVSLEGQVEQVDVRSIQSKGVYMVRLMNESSKMIYSNKILIQ